MTSENPAPRADEAFLKKSLEAIPKRYSPVAHFVSTSSIGLGGLALAFAMVDSFGVAELTTVLVMVVVANLVEWIAHKEMLHKRRRYWEVLYDQHTPMHHRMYREASMAVGSRQEWRFVLMPAKGVFGIAVLGIPIALAAYRLFGADIGWTVIATVAMYVSAYEVLHLAYHMPDGNPLWGNRLVRALSRHHARHHDPKLMQKYNFNVTLPLWDWILRSRAPKRTEEEAR